MSVIRTSELDENLRLEAKTILEKIIREIINNPESVVKEKKFLDTIKNTEQIDENLRNEVKKVLETLK